MTGRRRVRRFDSVCNQDWAKALLANIHRMVWGCAESVGRQPLRTPGSARVAGARLVAENVDEVRKTVMALFCDLVGSTSVGERTRGTPLFVEQLRAMVPSPPTRRSKQWSG